MSAMFVAGSVADLAAGSLAPTADTPIPATSTWTDATGASVSVPPGVYVALGQVTVWAPGGASYMDVRLTDGTTVYGVTGGLAGPDNEANAGRVAWPLVSPAFTIASTRTVKLQASTGGGNGTAAVKATGTVVQLVRVR